MKKKPDINAFLESGAADTADRATAPTPKSVQQPIPAVIAKVHREQKVFRLPLDMITTLKREAYERSVATGSRVTETELVEQALTAFFNK